MIPNELGFLRGLVGHAERGLLLQSTQKEYQEILRGYLYPSFAGLDSRDVDAAIGSMLHFLRSYDSYMNRMRNSGRAQVVDSGPQRHWAGTLDMNERQAVRFLDVDRANRFLGKLNEYQLRRVISDEEYYRIRGFLEGLLKEQNESNKET